MSMSCDTFRLQVVHFQADELPAGERRAIEAHLEACPTCARRLELEDALLGALRQGLAREAAPPELRWRVQAALRREPVPWKPERRWLLGPWGAALAASLALAALLGLVLRDLSPAPTRSAAVEPVRREVVVVDRDCALEGASFQAQRHCPAGRHLNALQVDAQRYWNPGLDSAAGRRLALDPALRGRRLEVEGELYRGIDTLRVRRFEVLDRTTVDSARAAREAGALVARAVRSPAVPHAARPCRDTRASVFWKIFSRNEGDAWPRSRKSTTRRSRRK
jgi:anti-sigma factor (TIGR02949 family)